MAALAARAGYIAGGIVVSGAITTLVVGLRYYVVPLPERPFSPLHELLAPSGLVGQGLGIVGTAMMAFGVVAYGLRKRVRALHRWGKLSDWLRVHIFLCLVGPFLILLHTSFKFGGVVSIAFWSMAVVVASGAFGRWVYRWIPKTANGRFLGHKEVRRRLREILDELEAELAMTPTQVLDLVHLAKAPEADDAGGRPVGDRRRRPRPSTIRAALADSIRSRLGRRRRRAHWQTSLESAGVPEPVLSRVLTHLEEERRIVQQLQLLEPFQAAFRYWHAFHLPLATVMLLVLVVHVGVAIAFGYTWIWAR